jgi:hypothetical protein
MEDRHITDLERRLDEYWPREEEKIRQRLSGQYSQVVVETGVRRTKERWYHQQHLQADMLRAMWEQPDLFHTIQPILARLDPIGYSGYPGYDMKTRYQIEAGLIALLVGEADTLQDMEHIVRESFIRGQKPLTVTENGYLARYAEAAREIWAALKAETDYEQF